MHVTARNTDYDNEVVLLQNDVNDRTAKVKNCVHKFTDYVSNVLFSS